MTANSGSSVSGLGEPLIKFMDLDSLYAVIDIPEESLSQITLNTPVTFKVADQNISEPITGEVIRISNYAIEKEGDTIIEAYVKISSGKDFLRPGLSIDAYIDSQA